MTDTLNLEARPALIVVPHGEGGGPVENAEWMIAEAMRLDSSSGTGRIKFYRSAKHAVASMLAAGWTPPSRTGQTEETARLREQLAEMQARLDEMGWHLIRMQSSEQAADNAFRGMTASAAVQAVKLRQQRDIELRANGGTEPTLTYKQVANALDKLANLGKNTAERTEAKLAKERTTVAVPLPEGEF